ncbi:MAG: hypothetical protein Q4B54_10130 [Coriobacteriales bacterium]|nr:hypothetical protein [Coriobacteriales bacterium]
MLAYKFSAREKVLLTLLIVVALGIIWYRFVFLNIQDRITALDAQIANVQEEMSVGQAQAASLSTMRKVVEEYQAKGITPTLLPSYDNTQNLMAFLNGVLSGTKSYSISFDTPSASDDGSIHRTGKVHFACGSYGEARTVAQAIAQGPYPCTINSLSISDDSSKGGSCSADVQFTFFEKAVSASDASKQETTTENKGQDLSQMSHWNE